MWYRRNRSLIIICTGWCNCLVGAACPLPGGWYSRVENVLFWKSTAGPRPSRWYSWPENTTCLFMRLIVIPTIAPGMDSSLTSPRFNAHGRSSADCPRSLATAVFAVQSADCQRRNARDVLTRRLKHNQIMLTRTRLPAKLPCHMYHLSLVSCSFLLSRKLLSNVICSMKLVLGLDLGAP